MLMCLKMVEGGELKRLIQTKVAAWVHWPGWNCCMAYKSSNRIGEALPRLRVALYTSNNSVVCKPAPPVVFYYHSGLFREFEPPRGDKARVRTTLGECALEGTKC